MKPIILPSPLVSAEWLNAHLEAPNLVVLDATIPKAVAADSKAESGVQIPQARFFDLKHKFSDAFGEFPNTFPSEAQFVLEAQNLGINNDSAIVVYDDQGIYSSARAWWLFKAFGYDNVAVLDGGLPEWIKSGFAVEPKAAYTGVKGNFTGSYHPQFMKFFEDMLKESREGTQTIIDARSESRFKGLEVEPRAGLRSGSIPNSVNLPYTDLLENGVFKNVENLKELFAALAKPEDAITFSCGSGITACILALGAELSGYENISVYDGSWTEWGSLTEA
ncbi:sulfurtransferase [Mangrovimonas xylaniphaga]|uniref:sulfurtransferase n=1 Tax=Mangrovimonas xylaniphaga TaxID=1645915 RepID=UPI0006B565F1|nr:sulfurtransferase [Mangrovimonas xylaniphaga]